MKVNILVTGVGSSNSISFIKGLRRQDEIEVNIYGTDIYEKEFSAGAQFTDGFFKVPPACARGFIPSLLEICKRGNVQVMIPIIDEEFIPISQARDDFEQIGTRVMLPDHEKLLICQDKFQTHLFLKQNGFPTPETWLTIPDIPGYPILIKPRVGRGSRGVKVIQNGKELGVNLESGEYIYQEVIKGREFTVDTLSDMDGKILVVVPRVRLEVKNGVSYKGKTVKNRVVEEMCIDICETLGLRGPACLQCIVTDEGSPYFFEINPRIGSAVVLSVRAGVNIPLLAIKNILGTKVDNMIGRFQENVVMLRYWDEVYTLAC